LPAMPEQCCGGCGKADAARTEALSGVELAEITDPVQRLFTLVRQGSFPEASKALEAAPEHWHAADDEGHTLLHWAALAGNEAFVAAALEARVKADVAASNGQTPFMWAMIKGMVGVAKLLLEAGADPLATDSMGATPFMLTVQHQQHAALLLLAANAPREKLVKSADSNGCGAVHWAAYKGDLQSLKLLDYFDADFACRDAMGMTPLHRAVQASQGGVCEFLLDKQVDPSQTDQQGRTCMDIAKGNHDTAMRRTLDRLLEVAGSSHVGVVGESSDIEAPSGANLRRRDASKDEADKLKKKALQNAAATFWLVSVSLALFQYLTDLRLISWTVAPRVSLCFELGVPASLALFFTVALSDPGKVPARVKGCSGVEELLKALKAGEPTDCNRLCTTTWVIKGLRTKYCVNTGACVEEFDHFCGWLNCAIGRGNHRPFIILACVEAFTQFCHLYLVWVCSKSLVQGSSNTDWVMNLASMYPLLVIVALLHTLTAPGIVFLALNQLRLIGVNLTTNEMINVSRYRHFWEEIDTGGQKKRKFKNPFNKGSAVSNCIDFWWTRRRGDAGPGMSAAKAA